MIIAIYNVIFIDVYWYVYFVAFIVVLYVDNVNISIYIYKQFYGLYEHIHIKQRLKHQNHIQSNTIM